MNLRNRVFLLLIIAPVVYIVYLISLYDQIVPYLDQWELVPLLEKLRMGTLSFSDFFAQHNEHRILFPKVIMLTLAGLTDWNILYELYANVILAALTLVFLCAMLFEKPDRHPSFFPAVLFSLLVFSPAQWENWSWGWQVQIFLSVLATVISVWAAVKWPGTVKGMSVASASAIVATFSFANGLMTWIALGVVMLLKKGWKRKHLAILSVSFILVSVIYFYGFKQNPGHPSFAVPLMHPYDYLRYVLAYMGSSLHSPIVSFIFSVTDTSIGIGLFMVVFMVKGVLWLKRNSEEGFEKIIPFLALSLYVALSAAITGIGRLGFGVSQAMSSKYITISMLFAVSTLAVAISLYRSWSKINGRPSGKVVVIAYSVAYFLLASYFVSFANGRNEFKEHVEEMKRAAVCLDYVDTAEESCLLKLYPDVNILKERRAKLVQWNYLKKY